MTLKQRTMITIKNLAFQYKKKKPLFTDFSMDIENGSIVGILGKNGAGKSTLLNVITGLLFPLSGKVDVNGFTPAHRSTKWMVLFIMSAVQVVIGLSYPPFLTANQTLIWNCYLMLLLTNPLKQDKL